MAPMTKNMWRELAHSKGRFIAIILIILLGVLIFVGVKATGPGLNDSMNATVNQQKLSDIQVTSTTGFTQADVKLAEQVAGVQAETSKFKYVIGGKQKLAMALYGYQSSATQNKLKLTSGHLPKDNGEIVLDSQAKTVNGYRLGDKFTFSKTAGLTQRTYKIVGFADSPQYIDNELRGSANVGDGTVRLFAYIPARQMNLPVATQLNIRVKSVDNLDSFTTNYQKAVDKKVATLKTKFNQQNRQRSQSGFPKSQYNWQTREDLPGYTAYGEGSKRIAAIANVFPVFFFLIAALITFTTVTRMVEEARSQIGTFKALGYTKFEITRNYLLYALTAGLIGAILGAVIGNEALPRIVLSLYSQYIPMHWVVNFQWSSALIALGLALISTVGAALYVATRELAEKPAELMRPKAPKSGSKILLERIKPLWNRLSFNRKVSYRNLFRFKSRAFLTIIGIAGGTALILTGFGIQNSISNSSTQQFGNIFKYQAVVRLAKAGQDQAAKSVLKQDDRSISATGITAKTATVKLQGTQENDVNLYVPTSTHRFKRYVKLVNRNNDSLSLRDSGVIISQKMADNLNAQVGDTVKIVQTSGRTAKVRVNGITKNYMGHYVYMSAAAYQKEFRQSAKVNTLLVKLHHQTKTQRNHLANQLLSKGQTMGTSYTYDQQKTVNKMSSSLNPIIGIFVLLSGILSFVVLYNLTNINVSERMRELSTIKVLGFYDGEVTMYIVRENIILTILGIIVGYGVGNILTAYILHQAATEAVIFPLTIHWVGYVTATILMILFTAIVMYVTHKRLQHVDMIAALQSNE